MAKMKKISRKQLLKEPDKIITFSGRFIQFGMAHKNQLSWVALGVVAVIAIFTGVRYFSNQAEDAAFARWGETMRSYTTALKGQDAKAAYQAVKADFEGIIDKYAHRTAGKMARLTFAKICSEAGENQQALNLYTRALKDFDDYTPIRHLVLSGIAYAHEANNDLKKAAEFLQQIVSADDSILAADALYNLGRVLSATGDTERSSEIFKRIVADHPDAVYIDLIKERLAQAGAV